MMELARFLAEDGDHFLAALVFIVVVAWAVGHVITALRTPYDEDF